MKPQGNPFSKDNPIFLTVFLYLLRNMNVLCLRVHTSCNYPCAYFFILLFDKKLGIIFFLHQDIIRHIHFCCTTVKERIRLIRLTAQKMKFSIKDFLQ